MAADRLRPVVALDIDGVIRVPRPDEVDRDRFVSAEITMRQDEYPNLFHRRPQWDEHGESKGVEWFTPVGIEWVRNVVDHGHEVVLATTWRHYANTYFGDILGVPELEDALVHTMPKFSESSPAWKARNLSAAFPGRPLMWVDDRLPYFSRDLLTELRSPRDRALTYSHQIDQDRFGITEDDAAQMDAWLQLAGTVEGQQQLRAERRREMGRDRAQYIRSRYGSMAAKKAWDTVVARVLAAEPGQKWLADYLAGNTLDSKGQPVTLPPDTGLARHVGLTEERLIELVALSYVEGFNAPASG